MGQFLDKAIVEQISFRVGVNMNIWPTLESPLPENKREIFNRVGPQNASEFEAHDESTLYAYSTFRDINGKPVALLQATIPRTILARGKTAMEFASVWFIVVCLFMGLVIILMIRFTVLKPVLDFTKRILRIKKTANLSARVALDRRDEIGALSLEFEKMMRALEDAQNKLIEQSYTSGMAEMAIGALHNIGNAVHPIAVRMGVLDQKLEKINKEHIYKALDELDDDSIEHERKEKLRLYVEKSIRRLLDMSEQWRHNVEYLATQVTHIEQILTSQQKLEHVERPVREIFLETILRDSIKLLSTELSKGVTFEVSSEIESLPPIKAERIRLLQVFTNLFINALESIHAGVSKEKKISISGKVKQVKKERVLRLSITDTGIGIEKEQIKLIFEKGFTTKEHENFGLGLHWCANTLAGMKSRIYAESKGYGKGATVHLHFPLSK